MNYGHKAHGQIDWEKYGEDWEEKCPQPKTRKKSENRRRKGGGADYEIRHYAFLQAGHTTK